MAVNVRGVFFVLQAAVRAMAPRGTGSIVTVCSTSGFTASTGPMTVYDASKGAVRLLTQAAAREVAAAGVRVNAVAPGTVETDLTLGLASPAELAALGATRVSRSAGSDARRRSPRPSRSSPRTRRRTSPATSSSSTAAGSPDVSTRSGGARLSRSRRPPLDIANTEVHDAAHCGHHANDSLRHSTAPHVTTTAASGSQRADREVAVVELRGIKKSFGANEVLHGVDLTVHAGEHVVIFGPSGSGKSTCCARSTCSRSRARARCACSASSTGRDPRRAEREARKRRSSCAATSAWSSSSSTSSRT